MEQAGIWQKFKNGDYPLLTLELRRLQRGKLRFKLVLILIAAVSMCALVGVIIDAFVGQHRGMGYLDLPFVAVVALTLLAILKWIVSFLIVPIYCARSIAGERQSGSLQMLAVTPMSSASIVGQKLAVGFGFGLAAMLASLPMLLASTVLDTGFGMRRGFPFLFSGVGPWGELVYPAQVALYASTAVVCSCLCVTISSATMLTYVMILFVLPMVMAIPTIPLMITPMMRGMSGHSSPYDIGPTMIAVMVIQAIMQAGLAVLFTFIAIRKFDTMRRLG